MSQPHDLLGRGISLRDVVALPLDASKLHLGVVTAIFEKTGALRVTTAYSGRKHEYDIASILFPANQVVIIDRANLKPVVPDHALILRLLEKCDEIETLPSRVVRTE